MVLFVGLGTIMCDIVEVISPAVCVGGGGRGEGGGGRGEGGGGGVCVCECVSV